MKKVLVTGADGFIGSHLSEMLLERNFKVRALSYYNSFNNWGWLEEIPSNDNIEILSGDIRDPHFINEIVRNMDIVFNLAALIAIPYSYHAPDSYIDTNIKGTLNICQAAKNNGNIRVIQTSTSEVYGTACYVPIDEKHPKQPQSPYSATKIGADAISMSFYNSFELPVTIARPFNTFGPRQSARAFIPTIITQIASGKNIIDVGDLRPTRDFNFVKDTCEALIEIANTDNSIGKEVNICTGTEYSMNDVIAAVQNIMKTNVKIKTDEQRFRPTNSEVLRLCGDNTLLKELTGFTHKYNLTEGLKITCDWFLNPENLKKYKTNIYNL